MRLLVFVLLFLPLVAPLAARAEPSTKDLKTIERDLQQEQDRQAEIKAEEAELQTSVSTLKQQLVQSAAKVQNTEKELSAVEAQLAELNAKEKIMQDAIAKKRLHLSKTTAAWLRLARTPPELLLLAPLPPEQIIHAGASFHHVVPLLYKEAEQAREDLFQLQQLQTELKDKQASATQLQESLQASQAELGSLLDAQQDKRSDAEKRRRAQDQKVAALAAQAADLRDLLKKLEAEKAARKKIEKTPAPKTIASGMAMRGTFNPAILPVAGAVKVGYGDKDDIGMTSKGLVIASRAGATVTAPFAGEVQYTGNFRSYGNIVILTRDDGVHALLSGFGKIYARRGDQIGRGAPLGVLPSKPEPNLYVEYRKGTDPIDPRALNLSDSRVK